MPILRPACLQIFCCTLRSRNEICNARTLCPLLLGLYLGGMQSSEAAERWFEEVKAGATPAQLYRLLYAMPKGGDLHNHLGGTVRSEWFWDAAMAAEQRGYVYYTRVRLMNCAPYGHDEFGASKALLLFKDIQASKFEALDACGQSEFKRLRDLDAREKQAWLDSLRLDQSFEGRNEFFCFLCTGCKRGDRSSGYPVVVMLDKVSGYRIVFIEGILT